PEGRGDHVFFTIEKAGLTTHKAVADIARALGVRARDIGFAGLKDAHAVTRQTLSVEHVDPARIEALELPRIRVLAVARHPRKLRVGHLAANRFTIRLRDVAPDRLDDARRVLAVLARRGVPNYFGRQRFGTRGDTAEIGRRLVDGDLDGAVSLIAGAPGPHDTGAVRRAREAFEAGAYREAATLWPRAYAAHARLSRAMAREKGDARRALRALDRRLLRLFVNAYQSWLFNEVLARRIDALDRVLDGDLACRHDSGGIFRVEDAAVEQPRAAAFEISPTGPLPGPEMRRAEGVPGAIEEDVLRAAGRRLEDFPARGPFRVTGGRRPLRFPLADAGVEPGHDEAGDYFEFRFTLPPGCYATAVLREVCKERLTASPDAEADEAVG
ncbi:MAG TPA: tRNA pseudouridine(13) synthase TruD, partial [Longimicrobiales bacterium]